MNSRNTVIYIKVSGRKRDGFVDPPKFDWDLAKDRRLWFAVSTLANKDDIDWQILSRELDAPEYFLRKRSYNLLSKHLKLMEEQIERKTRNVESSGKISIPEESVYKEQTESGTEEYEHDPGEEAMKNMRKSKIISQKRPSGEETAGSSISELSNLSVSKSALEEALMDRLQL